MAGQIQRTLRASLLLWVAYTWYRTGGAGFLKPLSGAKQTRHVLYFRRTVNLERLQHTLLVRLLSWTRKIACPPTWGSVSEHAGRLTCSTWFLLSSQRPFAWLTTCMPTTQFTGTCQITTEFGSHFVISCPYQMGAMPALDWFHETSSKSEKRGPHRSCLASANRAINHRQWLLFVTDGPLLLILNQMACTDLLTDVLEQSLIACLGLCKLVYSRVYKGCSLRIALVKLCFL